MAINEQDFVRIHVLMVTVVLTMVALLAFTLGCFFTAKRYYDCTRYTQEDFSREIAPLGCYDKHYDPDYRNIYQGVHIA